MGDAEIMRLNDGETTQEQQEGGKYVAVRYNAMTHGILSQHVVLPHEDQDEYDVLLSSLVAEHQPSGLTEMHLVEELAGIIWRKRRVLLAEGAKINRGLRASLVGLDKSSSSTVKSAVPGNQALAGAHVDFRDLMTMTADEVTTRVKEAMHDIETTETAEQILKRNRKTAYNRALKTLEPGIQDWWQDLLEEGEVEATAVDLRKFIQTDLLPIFRSQLAATCHHEAIKQQVIGEGFNAPVMEHLSRYETHLDRKFQRTLAMLIKLKELSGKQ